MISVLIVFADANYASTQRPSWVDALRYAQGRIAEQKAALAAPVLKVFIAQGGAVAQEFTPQQVGDQLDGLDAGVMCRSCHRTHERKAGRPRPIALNGDGLCVACVQANAEVAADAKGGAR